MQATLVLILSRLPQPQKGIEKKEKKNVLFCRLHKW